MALRWMTAVRAVPAEAVIGEPMVALVLTDAFLDKFGGDNLAEIRRHVHAFRDSLFRAVREPAG